MNRILRHIGLLLPGVWMLTALPFPAAAQSPQKKVVEGNRLYQEEKYDQALNLYQDALLSLPENKRIRFNVANSLYRKKKFEEALKEYQQVVGAEELPLEAETYFNMGNTLYRMGKLPESILAYQQALKLNPGDLDAKYNLEYVRRKLKQEAQKQPQSGAEQDQQSQPGQPQPQDKPEEGQKPDSDQKESAGEQADHSEEKPVNPKDAQQLSKEDAERILNALKNDEKDLQKKRKMKTSGKRRIKKDW